MPDSDPTAPAADATDLITARAWAIHARVHVSWVATILHNNGLAPDALKSPAEWDLLHDAATKARV